MASTLQTRAGNLGTKVVIDENAGKVAQANVLGGSGTLYGVMIDLSENPAEDIYLKLVDATSVTVATVRPGFQFWCAAGDSIQYTFPEGITLDTGLSYFLAQESGAAVAPTGPTGKVKVYLNCG